MWVKSIQLKNIKGFADSGVIEFSKSINVFVGANNAGKSTLLQSLWLLQGTNNHGGNPGELLRDFFDKNIRAMAEKGEIQIAFAEPQDSRIVPRWNQTRTGRHIPVSIPHSKRTPSAVLYSGNRNSGYGQSELCDVSNQEDYRERFDGRFCHTREPHNFIYPYFSRRKASSYQMMVSSSNAETVEEVFENLPSKIDRIANREYPSHEVFREECWNALNLNVSCAQWRNGKQAGLILEDGSLLPIDTMGEGTINIVGLLAHLSSASGKLFLIEEIENDLHPKALKSLLEFILKKSKDNQFIISTHSNIVARYLGVEPETKLFAVEMNLEKPSRIPTSTCNLVSNTPEDRLKLLENLGYEPFDFFMWKAFLILEESTAERIIRDFLIPYMVPQLQGKLRTIAASGVSDVEARFSDMLRLFVFLHTTPQYKMRAWVAVDSGIEGGKVISSLKSKLKEWPESHFRIFESENFESYYPPTFSSEISQVITEPNGLEKQRAKGKLAEDVLSWALKNPNEAKIEFRKSANEILNFLQEIQTAIK